jgi:hypothetical protein
MSSMVCGRSVNMSQVLWGHVVVLNVHSDLHDHSVVLNVHSDLHDQLYSATRDVASADSMMP